MYTQFFGNYLLNEKLITPEQLIDVMGSKKNTKIKFGFGFRVKRRIIINFIKSVYIKINPCKVLQGCFYLVHRKEGKVRKNVGV